MNILITGGAGAIGSTLTKSFLDSVDRIVVIDDLSSGYKDLIPSNDKVYFIEGSISDKSALDKAFSFDINRVYHFAAHFANQNSVDYPSKDLNVNGNGTLLLLEYSNKYNIDLFVYASSSCVYGNISSTGEESVEKLKLDTPYAITKLLGEYYCKFFYDYHNLPIVILRIFNSYGPGEKPGLYRNVIPNFFQLAINNESLTIYGTGNETRCFNYIDNLVQAVHLVSNNKNAIGETFNIGTDSETKIIDLASKINNITGNTSKIIFKPRRSWDHVLKRTSNIEKAKKILNYSPVSDLNKGLEETYKWLLKNL